MSAPLLKLGTRKSPLAMVQAEETRARLCAAHGWEESAVELVPVIASGDRIQDRPLAEIGGKALWTKELDGWLQEGRIDASVHSMKDVETIRPEWLAIAAVLPRADRRDRMVGAASIAALPQNAIVGTSAPRRAAQLLHARPDCTVVPIRGNVATRPAKLAAGEVQATFLAAAGLERLGEHGVGHALEVDDWLPAPAQGAIGIECRADDKRTLDLLAAIDHPRSHAEVLAERALLCGLGGTCHSPVAALSEGEGEHIALTAAIFGTDGAQRIAGRVTLAVGDEGTPRRLAADLLARAPDSVRALFGGAA